MTVLCRHVCTEVQHASGDPGNVISREGNVRRFHTCTDMKGKDSPEKCLLPGDQCDESISIETRLRKAAAAASLAEELRG